MAELWILTDKIDLKPRTDQGAVGKLRMKKRLTMRELWELTDLTGTKLWTTSTLGAQFILTYCPLG